MLRLKNIKKSYKTGDFVQHALKGIDIEFRKNEFVSILGPSGSGKTTLLNIIGGLDRYDSGDLIINSKSTKKFKDTEWDAYRNNCIGFIFQSYNLIGHINVLENVEMGMTLSGVNPKKKRKKALEVLKKVGLEEHAHKKPNQLSGGQMQRVAIARALANDPDIILADEPTGALDSKTSAQIMDLIKEISKDKLVIMVTHNSEIAEKYSTRIVELKDGELVGDSNPITNDNSKNENFKIKKTAMSFKTSLKLSLNNIFTKKGRTILTAFASSIGIIGIALILSLSNGFDIQIKKFERDSLTSLPIMISEQAIELDEETMHMINETTSSKKEFISEKVIYPKDTIVEQVTYQNKLNSEYVDYIENIDPNLVSGISYTRITGLNIINSLYKPVNANSLYFSVIPRKLAGSENETVFEQNYDLLDGHYPENQNEILLIVDSSNNVTTNLLEALALDEKEEYTFDDLYNQTLKLILNDDYYTNVGAYYLINTNFEELYNSENGISLKISGIVRIKEERKMMDMGSGIAYTNDLVDYVIEQNSNSKVVVAQKNADYNVLSGEKFDLSTEEGKEVKENLLAYLGADAVPLAISIYPVDFDSKDAIINYLDEYNENNEEKIIYNDLGDMISSLSGNIMDAVTVVLIAFSAISLIVSSIMIGIITYISVLERTKEIGILRSLGARKKDIKRVFTAETFIIGMFSGLLGVLIGYILVMPANMIIENLTELPNVANLNPLHALILIAISVTLTVIGGYIPAKIASKKDPVIALRTE